jgi:hypothetical protein
MIEVLVIVDSIWARNIIKRRLRWLAMIPTHQLTTRVTEK